jgi:hypothetical protein
MEKNSQNVDWSNGPQLLPPLTIVVLGEAVLQEAREVAEQIEDRVQRMVQEGLTESV